MNLLPNTGTRRVLDVLRDALAPGVALDLATPEFGLFAFDALRDRLAKAVGRVIVPDPDAGDYGLLGGPADRAARNTLRARWLAGQGLAWLGGACEVRQAPATLPQALAVVRAAGGDALVAVSGSCPLTTAGLGLTPGNRFGMIQATETPAEAAALAEWFALLWAAAAPTGACSALAARLAEVAARRGPQAAYLTALAHLFARHGDGLDEERIVKSATGIRETLAWRKLFRFQRDGAVGAIDKLETYGGCILADSVGLGKTFEALAVIKYYELRNDRVLVLCPKRLRDNWTLYKANDRRNPLAGDRLHYDVFNHTDLSRDRGTSGDHDLAHVNWGNYDLVVIDESHNFRNKKTPRAGSETRYDKLMRRVIREGVKTRVLMLSATPVNNRLADLKNQIAFATGGDDAALQAHGVVNIGATVQRAQKQFNAWLKLPDADRRPAALMDMLGLDYFQLLDLLTIARSRKHVERYYGTAETGKFPDRLKPINVKSDIDRARAFPPVAAVNDDIRRLRLAAYAPLRYVLPARQAAYDAKYSQKVKGGTGVFRQADREESLVHLLRVNLLKRLESAVPSFALTVERQRQSVETLLTRLDDFADGDGVAADLSGLDLDDPALESLTVGRRVKVLLCDVDRVRWRQDLAADRDRLAALADAARQVGPARDAKLADLKAVLAAKVRDPLNPGNRKAIVFTAFSDTAEYLYEHLAPWAAAEFGLHTACVTGSGRNRTNLPRLRTDMATVLSAFAPRAKERPADCAAEGDLDLLIATDCISEGQNLQDCDFLVNYDIHWNPVRIVQRFGRIDRIGSPNARVQLVNFWPNMELEEYINLEARVSGRMVLLDVSATGEENVIEQQSGDPMNDLEYRRKQLLKLQDAVIDLEDLSSGVSITDLTLNDFRMDFARLPQAERAAAADLPLGACAVAASDGGVAPGAIFCLRAVGPGAEVPAEPGYPLAPHYLVHVADDGSVVAPFAQAKASLDALKRLSGGPALDDDAWDRFDALTRSGERMGHYQSLLAAAVGAVVGRAAERDAASLFAPGGTHGRAGEFAGSDDFEVVAFVAVLPAAAS